MGGPTKVAEMANLTGTPGKWDRMDDYADTSPFWSMTWTAHRQIKDKRRDSDGTSPDRGSRVLHNGLDMSLMTDRTQKL